MEFRSIPINWTKRIPPTLPSRRGSIHVPFPFYGIPAIYSNEDEENREREASNSPIFIRRPIPRSFSLRVSPSYPKILEYK